MQNFGIFAHLKENADAFWTKQMKEVGSVPLSDRICLQKRKTLECGHPNSSPTACGGPSGGLQGWNFPPNTLLPTPLHPCCICSQRVRMQHPNNNQEWGEEQDDAKVRRRLCGTSEITLRPQCCVPFLGICPPPGCTFPTGKSDDCILRHFYLSKKFTFVVFNISGTLCIDL